MAGKSEIIQRIATERPFVGDTFSSLALTGQFIALHCHPAKRFAVNFTVTAHGHAAHVFRTTCHHDISGSSRDGANGQMHGHFARPTFTVDGQARHGDRPTGTEQGCTGDVGGLLANLRDIAKYHIVDQRRRHIDPFQQPAEHQRPEVIGAHAGQAAAELADWRAYRINYDDVFHNALALSPEPGTCLPSS
ncbi:hypothetical protein D3C87_1160300 [compost metagenome]